ncbi:MAG: hypothetical protein LDL19_08300 [Thiobacillus sp.]|nr:hypothetical protein [Thiobacillus sp.]
MKAPYAWLLAGCLATGGAHASCGAAFCSSSNDWLTLTQDVAAGWRAWMQAEYIKQDQLRRGTEKLSPGQVASHHEEVKTLNRNALFGLEFGFMPEWSASLVLPVSNREHLHIHHHHGTPIPETWQYDQIGDARVTLRYQPATRATGNTSWSVQGGLKLPTGRTDVRNADGDEAERSVQPGTGTTDLLLGGGIARRLDALPGTLFANLTLQAPLDENGGYRPGGRAGLQAGWLLPVQGRLDLILQGNVLHLMRDRGIHAEPEDSGRTEVALVPGLAYAWSRQVSVYGQLELPVYQRVNGIQLAHDYALSLGLSFVLD